MGGVDYYGLDGEGLAAVLGEHCADDLVDEFELGLVCCGDVDEDVGGVERDFGVIAVDDWGHREHLAVLVVDDGVDWGITDDGKEFREMFVFLWTEVVRSLPLIVGSNGVTFTS